MDRTERGDTRSSSQSDAGQPAVMHKPGHKSGRREGKMVNKQEVIAAIQEKHQETIEKLNRLWNSTTKNSTKTRANAIRRNMSKNQNIFSGIAAG